MSIAYADIMKTSPDVDAADVEAREAIRLQPDWHYVKDVLIPQIETKRRSHAFDYLLGDWEFTGNNRQYGAMRGFWSATRLDDSTIFDEFRIVGDHGETYYVTRTVRAFNAKSGQWELVSTENGGGLQNSGTATRDGGEVHVEQTFGAATPQPSRWRIRYYDIHSDHFSWVADRTNDGGKTWVTEFQKLDVKRIGPERSFALTAAKEVQH